jgi:type II secretion system protein H
MANQAVKVLMPIWGRGVCSSEHTLTHQGCGRNGFTLLELLVTLVVLSVAAAVLVPKTRNSAPQQLQSEARQLAALLRIAQQESLLRGVLVRLVWTPQGYLFEQLDNTAAQTSNPAGNPQRWVPVRQEPLLRPRAWRTPGIQGWAEYDGQVQQTLILGAGLAGPSQRVVLVLPPHRSVVQSLGVLGFDLVQPNVQPDVQTRSQPSIEGSR